MQWPMNGDLKQIADAAEADTMEAAHELHRQGEHRKANRVTATGTEAMQALDAYRKEAGQ
jgi:hypothetical protein